ncbi:MAG TPA: hypothetical protein VME01_05585, partial [Solirubrobacteraceae bacterium]|nr:hypothetical protein [Solirubrobacteraceae bacterium]
MAATSDARPGPIVSLRGRIAGLRSNSIAGAGLVLVGATTFANGVNFIFHIVQTHLLGPSRYGELSALLNLVIVLSLPLSAIEAAVAQMVATHVGRHERVALRATLRWWGPVAIGSMIVVMLLSPVIKSALKIDSIGTVALLAAWSGPAMLAAVLQGALIGERRIKAVAVTQFANSGSRLIIGVALSAAGFGVFGAFAGTVLAAVVMCGVLYALVGPQIHSRADGPMVNTSDVIRSASSIGGITVMIS